jgi:hypothetical protein
MNFFAVGRMNNSYRLQAGHPRIPTMYSLLIAKRVSR